MSVLRTSTPMSTLDAIARNDDRIQIAHYSSRWQSLGPDVLWDRPGFMGGGASFWGNLSNAGDNWDLSIIQATESKGGQRRPEITGVTRDSTGAALGNCTVHLMDTQFDFEIDQVTSDSLGNYTVKSVWINPYAGQTVYAVAYLAGSPDVFGTTANNLTPS